MTYRIVVGVDGSVHGNAALRWALDEALAHAAEIIAVFAWQMPFIGIPGAFDREEMERICKRFLEETVAAIVPEPRVPMTKPVSYTHLDVYKRQLLGYAPEELIGRPMTGLIHRDDRTIAGTARRRMARTGEIENVSLRFRRKDGTLSLIHI